MLELHEPAKVTLVTLLGLDHSTNTSIAYDTWLAISHVYCRSLPPGRAYEPPGSALEVSEDHRAQVHTWIL